MTLANEPTASADETPLLLDPAEQQRNVAGVQAGLEQDVQGQMARLSDGWGHRLTADDPMARLVASLTRSLVEAGFEIHDCARKARTGGVCLTPISRKAGVIVTWTTHDALCVDPKRYVDGQATREVMNFALCDTLVALGWDVREYDCAGANLVIGRLAVRHQEASDE